MLLIGRPCYEVHGACDNRINLYPAAPIRLAKVLLAWTIAQEGWGSSFERQIGKCQFAMPGPPHRHLGCERPTRHVAHLHTRRSAHAAACQGQSDQSSPDGCAD